MSSQTVKTGALLVFIIVLSPLLIGFPQPVHAEDPESDQDAVEYWAVIVALADYSLDALDMSANYSDAEDLYSIFGKAWGEDHVQVLVDEEATKSNISEAICTWLKENADVNDIAFIYFRGHGGHGYLYCYDAEYYSYNNDISNLELGLWIDDLQTDNVIITLDSCYSGAFIPYLSKPGRLILASSENDQLSYGPWELHHSLFTHYLLEAFSNASVSDVNGDHMLSGEEIFSYAKPRVDTFYQVEDHIQNPQIDDQYEGDMALVSWAEFDLNPHESALNITVDDTVCSCDELPKMFWWTPGSVHYYEINSTNPAWISTRSQPISQGQNYHLTYLRVESDYGNPQGEGWYCEGTEATVRVTSPNGILARNVLTRWGGDPTTDNESNTTVIMNRPKTVVAKWHRDYSQLYILIAVFIVVVLVVLFIRKRKKNSRRAITDDVASVAVHQDESTAPK
jgi:hypothetical protein